VLEREVENVEKAALITGATRGIGLAIAQRLAATGRTVIGISRSDADSNFPGTLFCADLSDPDETDYTLTSIADRYEISCVVNNVGVANPQEIEAVDAETFRATIALNLAVPVKVTQTFLPGMKAMRYGRILNISSRAALGRPYRTSYAAAKSGMIGMTRSWALELAEFGITANVLAPGLTETGMMRKNNPNIREQEAQIPMKRAGQPDEIAAAAAFLVSHDASYVTGQVLYVCGGLSVGVSNF
jgi:NAD(P)-dependent dehydrogenase (short-subunit alcohol dehydrogenase family)